MSASKSPLTTVGWAHAWVPLTTTTAAVATAAPDGYTLLTGSNGPLTVNPFVQAKLPYDPLKDFVPVGLANLAPHSIVLHNSIQVKSVAELVELSKKQQITLGTSGVGSSRG